VSEAVTKGDIGFVEERTLLDYVTAQRWFGSKAREVSHAHILDTVCLRTEQPSLVAALAEIRFHPGTHELYQLLVGLREGEWEGDAIARADGRVAYDALTDPTLARELVHMIRADTTVRTGDGAIEFRPVDLDAFGLSLDDPRPLNLEQSNSSVVFGDELILKAYRRLEPGINPELELLRFLTRRGFPNIAALAGWYAYVGPVLEATLGLLQRYVPDAVDGWTLVLEAIENDPYALLDRIRRLGEVTGAMHSALASDVSDPEFAPEEPSVEAIPLLVASVDEEIERVFVELPDDEALAPIAGRGEEVRDRLRLISHAGPAGHVIRHHGDYHLGQVLWADGDWIVLDFEGEPARSLAERRRKRSPLRDVAGMLRSFAYAASAARVHGGRPAPPDWEQRARDEFLAGYMSYIDRRLLPPGHDALARLLAVFELEKAVYELRYELNNRPDWVGIPVEGIVRLLEAPL
jgi:maltokinase